MIYDIFGGVAFFLWSCVCRLVGMSTFRRDLLYYVWSGPARMHVSTNQAVRRESLRKAVP